MLFTEGTVALVTGASRGIGSAIAADLAAEGATVVVNYNSGEAAAKDTVARIEASGGEAIMLGADVGDERQAARMFSEIRRRYGRLDVLVANAGIADDSLVMSMRREQLDRVLRVNVEGIFLCCREAARIMTPRRSGSIVTLSSYNARGAAGVSGYAASKGAVTSFTKSLAAEVGRYKVRANVVSPGLVETGLVSRGHSLAIETFLSRVVLERPGTCEEIARLVSFLASDRASYITGADVAIDGGASLGLLLPDARAIAGTPNRRRMSGALPTKEKRADE
jgi:3-oxoacyl-[acyl-carrier protein] reductase